MTYITGYEPSIILQPYKPAEISLCMRKIRTTVKDTGQWMVLSRVITATSPVTAPSGPRLILKDF